MLNARPMPAEKYLTGIPNDTGNGVNIRAFPDLQQD
jgi:hypothetical protein